jgi:hypothetical protein
MAVSDTDIKFYYSGDGTPQGSLGGAITSNEVPSSGTNVIFDDVSAEEAQSGDVEYRCIYVKNTNTTDTLYDARVFIAQDTLSADDEIDIGLDPAGVGDGTNTGVATSIADEGEAPTGVTFSHPTDYASGLVIGDLGPGQCIAIWIRRTVNAGAAAIASNSFQIKVQGQTA